MIWTIMEAVIVVALVAGAALYFILRTIRSLRSGGSSCKDCASSPSSKSCHGCSLHQKLLVLFFVLGSVSICYAAEPMKLTSSDIRPGDFIPSKFTCQSRNVSPRLEFVNVPDMTQSLAIVVHDPDAPSGDWVHWVVFNIPADKFEVEEAISPGVQGLNSSGHAR